MNHAVLSRLSPILDQLKGGTTKARALRGSGLTIFHVFVSNLLRLLSNLVLTRLLFPEAFGLMALMQTFIYGLQLFSDIGINAMLIQHRRGGDRVFLDTLWTLQILRGLILWLGASAISYPVAQIYEQPQIMILLPVLALSLVIDGFKTTKEAQANRDLTLGRVVSLDLGIQVIGLIILSILAFLLQSVWALIYGTLIGAALRVAAFHFFLHGGNNRLHWDWSIVRETFGFGSFVLLSTIASFALNRGSQLVLAAYVDIALFGIFSIAILLGRSPGLINNAVAQKVIFPLYRIKRPDESAQNKRNLFRARRMVALFSIGMLAILAFIGDWLVQVLYDPRYAQAGPMIILISSAAMVNAALVGSKEALLGCGDSKRYFYLMTTLAATQIAMLFAGVIAFGIVGVIVAPAFSFLLTYPLRAWLISRYNAWDPKGDLALLSLGFALGGTAVWAQWDRLVTIF